MLWFGKAQTSKPFSWRSPQALHVSTPFRATAISLLLMFFSGVAQAQSQKFYDDYGALANAGHWNDMLRKATNDLKTSWRLNAEGNAFLRLMAISAISRLSDPGPVSDEINAQVNAYYQDVIRTPGSDPITAQVHQAYAGFLLKTGQPGKAIAPAKLALKFFGAPDYRYKPNVVFSHQHVAEVYAALGDLAAARAHYDIAMKVGAAYYRHPVQESRFSVPIAAQVKAFVPFLVEYGYFAASIRDVSAIEAQMKEVDLARAAVKANMSLLATPESYETHLEGAQYLSLAGAHDRARAALNHARELRIAWETKYPPTSPAAAQAAAENDVGFACADAALAARAGQAVSAESGRACISGEAAFPRGINFSEFGLIEEALGNESEASRWYQRTVDGVEVYRDSFDVSVRTGVLDPINIRDSYHGLIRVLSSRAAASPSRHDFFEAVAAAEKARARQFLDTQRAAGTVTADILESAASSMPRDYVVLSLVSTERAFISTAFTSETQSITVTPVDLSSLESEVRAVRRMLEDPTSDVSKLQDNLDRLVERFFGRELKLLRPDSKILVAIDGPLATLPFGLFSPTRGGEPLGITNQITIVPAIRALRQPSGKSETANSLLAFADPRFDSLISMEEFVGRGGDAAPLAVTRGIKPEATGLRIQALPETRTEVLSINKLFRSRGSVFVGDEASEGRFKKTSLSKYGYIHFATHGILGGEIPGVGEPALLLSPEAGEDSFLRASEIEQLKLGPALVTLSACNTGNGTYVWGEGIIGLGRAFLQAGARSVVASLWAIDSASAETFMVDFYRAHLAGKTASASLSVAAASVRAKNPHPYYWAPFVVISNQRS